MPIESFLDFSEPVLDVRSPSEYLQGHIPAAISFPLFSDEERAGVGTLYKKKGGQAALKLGLDLVGPKLASFVEKGEKLASPSGHFRIYCARGGMRSSSLHWLLETAGFRCTRLSGGYKAFRRWTLDQFEKEYQLSVLGGLTGSGKTEKLLQLEREGEQVLNLEEFASHRGSSFGHLGCAEQPSCEHFENLIAVKLSQFDPDKTIWIEDESRMIGKCRIPQGLWGQMSLGKLIWLSCPKEERIERLSRHYTHHPEEEMVQATLKLAKKLGAVKTGQIIEYIQNHHFETAISTLLDYYDQAYSYSCQKREKGVGSQETGEILP